jgi:P63C domain
MEPADRVIRKFGGQSALARLIGKGPSTVQYWSRAGTVPSKWHPELLRLASQHGVELSADELVGAPRGELEEPRVKMRLNEAIEELAVAPDDDSPLSELPEARYRGYLSLTDYEIPCYVLSTGQRVIGRTSATELMTGIRGGGDLEKYLGVVALRPFIRLEDVQERMVSFRLPEVEGLERRVKGLPADLLIEIFQGLVAALEASSRPESPHPRLSQRQAEMAIKASMVLAACAKVGLDALIDEATGYQYERAQDALEVKLRAYLSDELRKWEKTFPDELWVEFARLTGWQGAVTKRPKYWGKLVMELVYEYLDAEVAQWLRDNAPEPRHRQNYHQWLSGQYGLKKLVEHLWMLIGVAKTCETITELRDKMAALNGRVPIQLRLYLPPPGTQAG